jgi:hypothetical protein
MAAILGGANLCYKQGEASGTRHDGPAFFIYHGPRASSWRGRHLMFAAKRLLCATAIAACCTAAAAFAQAPAPPPAGTPQAGTPPAQLNRITPSPSISGPTPGSTTNGTMTDPSPLLNPDTSWTPRTPRLPNASPDEPSLNAPLLPFDQ